jgi:hypothetical protein
VVGSSPTNAVACNASIITSTFLTANVGVDTGACGVVNPSTGRHFVFDPGDRHPGNLYEPSEPTRDPALRPTAAHPSTIEGCALLASDVDGILMAEPAARILIERLEPWCAATCERIVWWTLPRSRFDDVSTDTRPGVIYALPLAFASLSRAAANLGAERPMSFLEQAALCAATWNTLARTNAPIPDEVAPRRSPHRTFAALANPFEPLAAIVATGYSTLAYFGRPGTILLVAPRAP